MFDRNQLIKMAAHYFQDENREVMYATSDGNFFYDANLAYGHASGRSLEVETIYRKDVIEVSPILESDSEDIENKKRSRKAKTE